MLNNEVFFQKKKNVVDWEEMLKEWSQAFSIQNLGIRLANVLLNFTPNEQKQLLKNIEQAFRDPDDDLRWCIFEEAQKVGFDTAVGALALSLFWSYGSMSPTTLDPVYPDLRLSPLMLQCVLVIVAAQLAEDPADGAVRLISLCSDLEGV